MIKNILTLTITILSLFSCEKYSDLAVLTDTTTIDSNVKEVVVSSGIKLILDETIEKGVIEFTAPDDIHSFIKVSLVSEKITIYLDANTGDDLGVKVRMSPKEIKSYVATAGANISTNSPLTEYDLSLNISGTSEFNGKVECNALNLIVSGKSSVTLLGECGEFNIIECSGKSTINGYNFSATNISANLTGESKAYLKPIDMLNSLCSGNSHIVFDSETATIISKNSDGSTVTAL